MDHVALATDFSTRFASWKELEANIVELNNAIAMGFDRADQEVAAKEGTVIAEEDTVLWLINSEGDSEKRTKAINRVTNARFRVKKYFARAKATAAAPATGASARVDVDASEAVALLAIDAPPPPPAWFVVASEAAAAARPNAWVLHRVMARAATFGVAQGERVVNVVRCPDYAVDIAFRVYAGHPDVEVLGTPMGYKAWQPWGVLQSCGLQVSRVLLHEGAPSAVVYALMELATPCTCPAGNALLQPHAPRAIQCRCRTSFLRTLALHAQATHTTLTGDATDGADRQIGLPPKWRTHVAALKTWLWSHSIANEDREVVLALGAEGAGEGAGEGASAGAARAPPVSAPVENHTQTPRLESKLQTLSAAGAARNINDCYGRLSGALADRRSYLMLKRTLAGYASFPGRDDTVPYDGTHVGEIMLALAQHGAGVALEVSAFDAGSVPQVRAVLLARACGDPMLPALAASVAVRAQPPSVAVGSATIPLRFLVALPAAEWARLQARAHAEAAGGGGTPPHDGAADAVERASLAAAGADLQYDAKRARVAAAVEVAAAPPQAARGTRLRLVFRGGADPHDAATATGQHAVPPAAAGADLQHAESARVAAAGPGHACTCIHLAFPGEASATAAAAAAPTGVPCNCGWAAAAAAAAVEAMQLPLPLPSSEARAVVGALARHTGAPGDCVVRAVHVVPSDAGLCQLLAACVTARARQDEIGILSRRMVQITEGTAELLAGGEAVTVEVEMHVPWVQVGGVPPALLERWLGPACLAVPEAGGGGRRRGRHHASAGEGAAAWRAPALRRGDMLPERLDTVDPLDDVEQALVSSWRWL